MATIREDVIKIGYTDWISGPQGGEVQLYYRCDHCGDRVNIDTESDVIHHEETAYDLCESCFEAYKKIDNEHTV
jgi:CRISPR/Cas system-associated protein Cas10 (large subunit of type III CRISPR-Cas system)